MSSGSDDLLNHQYQDSSLFEARVALHRRFRVNPHGWHRWVFDQLDLPAGASVLELGCGPGWLWRENLGRVPADWDITLTDFSPGMLEQTRRNLSPAGRPFRFECADAQSLAGGPESFDAVIANHMLYHVPDRPRALAEIRRVLKPGGRLYAATNGAAHMRELEDLVRRFDPHLSVPSQGTGDFSLENGSAQLAPVFTHIELHRYEDALFVTEAQPLVDYIFSLSRNARLGDGQKEHFRLFAIDELQRSGGAIRIQCDSGLFIASDR